MASAYGTVFSVGQGGHCTGTGYSVVNGTCSVLRGYGAPVADPAGSRSPARGTWPATKVYEPQIQKSMSLKYRVDGAPAPDPAGSRSPARGTWPAHSETLLY